MQDRITFLRTLEPRNVGHASYVAILEATAGLFQQFPPDSITLRDILSISGVSNQTLYNYFPSGRDDVAIVLHDRFQRAILHDFMRLNEGIAWSTLAGNHNITRVLSASLARATFGYLKENRQLQSAITDYLKLHKLGSLNTHSQDLEEALSQEILQRYGPAFLKQELPHVVRLSIKVAHGIADVAMTHPDFPLEKLESTTRKLLRTLLQTGLKREEGASGVHDLRAHAAAPIAIVGAPISPAKRKVIQERILKRKRQA